ASHASTLRHCEEAKPTRQSSGSTVAAAPGLRRPARNDGEGPEHTPPPIVPREGQGRLSRLHPPSLRGGGADAAIQRLDGGNGPGLLRFARNDDHRHEPRLNSYAVLEICACHPLRLPG